MKKIVLSLASVLAATAFAPEASAVPVFARQTGMACSACHFQHFPLLNGFGRAFKAGAFTMIGAQGKVEDKAEHGPTLDIPDRLNMAVLSSAYYQKESGAGKTQAQWGVPASGGELSLFYGGRASEFAGFLSELGVAGAASTGAAKLVMLWPVGEMRAGVVTYTGGQGAAYSYEVLNTGAADTHKLMGNSGPNKQHVAATYAGSWLGTRTNATGVQAVVNGGWGFVSAGQYADAAPGFGTAHELPLTYIRAAATMDLAGWDAGFGVQNFTGSMDGYTGTSATFANTKYEATVLDAQMQGEVAGMSTGVYVTYGMAPANPNGKNLMAGGWSSLVKSNAQTQTNVAASSLNVAGTVEFMHGATVQAAMRLATLDEKFAGGKSKADNAVMVGATYDLTQNIALGLNYTTQSGSAWDGLTAPVGKTSTTFLLEALF